MKIKIKSNEEKLFILLKFNNLPMKPIILELWEKKSMAPLASCPRVRPLFSSTIAQVQTVGRAA